MSEDQPSGGITRRSFLTGTGVSVAAAGILKTSEALAADAAAGKVQGPGEVVLTLKVNGVAHQLDVEPSTTLADALRFGLALTGTKVVCDRGACSACTVHLDGMPVASCMTLAVDVGAREVTTIEGLARGDKLTPIQEQFIAHDATQCGFCTPGMVMSCAALLARNHHPTLDDVKAAVSGNLCRCGTYPKVFAAALAASGQKPPPGTQVVARAAVLHDEAKPTNEAAHPGDEPPLWPTSDKLKTVGKPQPRLDGTLKVTGRARYTADVRLPRMLFARRVTSPHPHARVVSIDVSAAERLPGVKAVHVVERNEGAKLRNPPKTSERYPLVRYYGQAVAAVAATSQSVADEAAKLVKVVYQPLPFVVDLDDARRADAPLVYPGPVDEQGTAGGGGATDGLPQHGNVRGPDVDEAGDPKAGFAAAELTVQGEFRTQVQTHSALESHGVVAEWRDDGLTVYASTQGTGSVRNELATVFDLPKSKVRVITEFMGGGFGAKFGAGSYGVLAAKLSKRAGAPVRLMLDRKEEHLCVGNRPATLQTMKIGAKKDGTLTAIAQVAHGNAGIATGGGVGWIGTTLYPATGVRSEQYDVFTNGGPAAAFRAPGQPMGAFAVEQLIDELAQKLALDPIALRDQLDAGAGPPGPGGNDEATRHARRVERKLGAERFAWHERRPPGSDRSVIKRGIGMAQSMWGRFVDLNASCEVRLHKDGSIELMSSVQDIGTGTRTALAMVVAEELGVRPADVTIKIGDTQYPNGPSSGGSKTLLSIAAPARVAAWRLKEQLYKSVGDGARKLPLKKAAAKLGTDSISVQATRAKEYGGDPHGGYGGVQFAAVAVDTETGIVKVERMLGVHDCGRVINPLAVQSQINGGILMGLSWALYEHRHMDRQTGRMVNANLDQYKIAGAREVPEIEVVLVEQYLGRNATDVNGIGEPANIATAAAIANAVYNAIGVRIRTLPMKPAVVLAALGKLGSKEASR
ncbi:MAG TPA: molybdopterin-dependent oxidoreductase [Polyangia bacterium]|jgi:xanthine dehydrogenase YagR molybdenum-binding subunit|nr:molybdopterin-dependent oxidoreductase [Polyangia bacterium]